MARQSAAALSVVQIEPGQRRPEPPDELTPRAAARWQKIVNSMPPDWFTGETHPMLIQLCRIIDRCADIADALETAKAEGADLSERRYQNLMRAEMQLSSTIARLSTKMRITQQSGINSDKKKHGKHKNTVPWDKEYEDKTD